jgi:DNA-binding HxlR family transcriptional regulator
MAAFDLLGRRWARGIVWHLNRGPASFRSLQSSCESIAPSILNTRLKDLTEAHIITRSDEGYTLTELGEELFQVLKPFALWSTRWASQISEDDKT